VSDQIKASTIDQAAPMITSMVLAVVLRVAGPVTIGMLSHGLGHPERQVSVRVGTWSCRLFTRSPYVDLPL
jgi:hypothetical protein